MLVQQEPELAGTSIDVGGGSGMTVPLRDGGHGGYGGRGALATRT